MGDEVGFELEEEVGCDEEVEVLGRCDGVGLVGERVHRFRLC